MFVVIIVIAAIANLTGGSSTGSTGNSNSVVAFLLLPLMSLRAGIEHGAAPTGRQHDCLSHPDSGGDTR